MKIPKELQKSQTKRYIKKKINDAKKRGLNPDNSLTQEQREKLIIFCECPVCHNRMNSTDEFDYEYLLITYHRRCLACGNIVEIGVLYDNLEEFTQAIQDLQLFGHDISVFIGKNVVNKAKELELI